MKIRLVDAADTDHYAEVFKEEADKQCRHYNKIIQENPQAESSRVVVNWRIQQWIFLGNHAYRAVMDMRPPHGFIALERMEMN